MSKGYVYVMVNPSLPGMVKVGKTERSPEERAQELSSATGVPTAFIPVYFEQFDDCDKAEKLVHEKLSSQQMRVSENREFFQTSPKEAIDALIGVISCRNDNEPESVLRKKASSQNTKKRNKTNCESPADLMFLQGKNAITGDCPEGCDIKHAIKLLEKAIKLGSKEAYVLLGYIYYFRIGIAKFSKGSDGGAYVSGGRLRHRPYRRSQEIGKDKNIEKGLSIWQEGIRYNSPYCKLMISINENNPSISYDWYHHIEDDEISETTALYILEYLCKEANFKANTKNLIARIDHRKLKRLYLLIRTAMDREFNKRKVTFETPDGDIMNSKLSGLDYYRQKESLLSPKQFVEYGHRDVFGLKAKPFEVTFG